jgi:hypothetical protein
LRCDPPTTAHAGGVESGAARGMSERGGSEDPEGLRSALLLELQRPLLDRGELHQAAGAHGMGAASRNQIRAQEGSCPGAWCWMPTELIEEVVVMAASAEDSQIRSRSEATQGRLCQRGHHHHSRIRWHPKAPTEGTPGATGLSRRAVRLHPPSSCLRSESCGSMSGFTTRTPRQLKPWWRSSVSSRRAPRQAAALDSKTG